MENTEHEICNNCKREIPQQNYVMHTMHCARNIKICRTCQEPISKAQFEEHEKLCKAKKPYQHPAYSESRSHFQNSANGFKKDNYYNRVPRLVDSGNSVSGFSGQSYTDRTRYSDTKATERIEANRNVEAAGPAGANRKTEAPSSKMLSCKFCDLDLPKLDLEEHENYCGSRTDRCLRCGELIMFRDKQSHIDSNHPLLKGKERNPESNWDSISQRSEGSALDPPRRRPQPFRTFEDLDYDPRPYLPSAYQAPAQGAKKKEESYKEISRRLDCKTEYIRNVLHDSAGITVPLRRSANAPRNHFYHDKGPAPQPPSPVRRRNPPTEILIPCEFCDTPMPHEELVKHETVCRPDLSRYNPRARTANLLDDYEEEQARAQETEEELPCEFCGNMIPASQLLGHQIRCT